MQPTILEYISCATDGLGKFKDKLIYNLLLLIMTFYNVTFRLGWIQKIQKEGAKIVLARLQPRSILTTHEHPWGYYTIPLERRLPSKNS